MTKNKRVPFFVANEAKEGKYILTLSGNIQKRYWRDDTVIDAKLLQDELDGITDDVVIKLNSPGGDVFQGVEMYNYLKDHPSNITVEVTGVAASAATFILAGADKVVMNVGTTVMIHEASTLGWGNKADMKKVVDRLETIDESILSIYVAKTGQSESQLTDWINSEKWFTADEAVKYGFADEVKKEAKASENTDSIDFAAMIKESVASAMAEFNPVINKTPEPLKQQSLLNKLRKGEIK